MAHKRRRAASHALLLWIVGLLVLSINEPAHAAASTTGTGTTTATAGGWDYAVIIDAGSSGSRVHVYRYYRPRGAQYAAVDLPDAVHKTTPGLSAYSFEPRTAANSLAPLLKFARDNVPEARRAATPLHLMATAGLRMLPEDAADAILLEVRRALSASGFKFKPQWARVISGAQEGLYGWAAVNYATGALPALAASDGGGGGSSGSSSSSGGSAASPLGRRDPPAKPTQPLLGFLDLGGGSLQVTFALAPHRRIPPNQAMPHAVPGLRDRQVYSHSFDGFGLQAAARRHEAALLAAGTRADPCLPSGFRAASGLLGGGNWDACKAAARALLPRERCTFSSCSLGNVFTPPLEGPLIGVDNFFYSARALQLKPGRVQLRDYEGAAKKFCAKPWDAIKREYLKHSQGSDTYAVTACFAAAHVLALLRDGLRLGNATVVGAAAPAKAGGGGKGGANNSSSGGGGGDGGLILANDVATPRGGAVATAWTLGALVLDVAGPARVGDADGDGEGGGGGDGSWLAAPDTEGGAALLAAVWCFGCMAAMAAASRARVGIIEGPAPRALDKTRSGGVPGGGGDTEMQPLLITATTGGGGGGGGGAGGGGGTASSAGAPGGLNGAVGPAGSIGGASVGAAGSVGGGSVAGAGSGAVGGVRRSQAASVASRASAANRGGGTATRPDAF